MALFPELELAPEVSLKFENPWPLCMSQGVYFIFGSGVRLLYVGKASMGSCIGARLSSHFLGTGPKGCRVVNPYWSEEPRFVASLAVPEGMAYEAPALEEYLIAQLSPPDNTYGR
jgi:excinuclease UvrABC nuclease subunit